MTRYNLTNLTTHYDFVNGVVEINRQADAIFGVVLLVGLWILIFFGLKNYESKRAFGAASFITLVAAVLMSTIGLVPSYAVVVLVLMTAGGAIMLITEQG